MHQMPLSASFRHYLRFMSKQARTLHSTVLQGQRCTSTFFVIFSLGQATQVPTTWNTVSLFLALRRSQLSRHASSGYAHTHALFHTGTGTADKLQALVPKISFVDSKVWQYSTMVRGCPEKHHEHTSTEAQCYTALVDCGIAQCRF